MCLSAFIWGSFGVFIWVLLCSGLIEEDEFQNTYIYETIKQLIKLKKLSYRAIEQILTYFAIVHNMSPSKKYNDYQVVIAFICYLKVAQIDVFEDILNNTITFSKLIEKTNLGELGSDYKLIEFLIRRIKYDFADKKEKQLMIENKEYKPNFDSYTGGNILRSVAQILNTLKSR